MRDARIPIRFLRLAINSNASVIVGSWGDGNK
jgi:hypothetical protein